MPHGVHALCLAALLTMLAPIPAAANGNVWSYVDEEGITHFSNVPDNSPYRLYLRDPDSYRLKDARARTSAGPIETPSLAIDPGKLPYADLVATAAREVNVDQALLHAIIYVESRNNPRAYSAKGAVGLMQVLPETAHRMGIDSIATPGDNIRAGARYLRFLLNMFDNSTPLALAAYNAGENAVIRHGNQIPPFPETIAYVPAVIAAYTDLQQRQVRVAKK